jgi:TetR/AcrR family transcriptional regulator
MEIGKRRSSEERRALAVDAVIDLASEMNPADITTAAISERMGLTQGALFRHFPNKDAVLQAVMESVSERILSRIDEAVRDEASPFGALRGIFMAHVGFVESNPGVPRLMFGELQRTEETGAKRATAAFLETYAARILERLDEAKQLGQVSSEVCMRSAAMALIGSIQGLVIQATLSGRVGDIRAGADAAFIIWLRGVSAA